MTPHALFTHARTDENAPSYRLRLIHIGTLADIRFSVDGHALTVVEADGTLTAPVAVAGVALAVAQRYSVLLTTTTAGSSNDSNNSSKGGAFWMRAELLPDMFTYPLPGQNTDVRGILTCVSSSRPLHRA